MILRILIPLTTLSVLLPRCCHCDPAAPTTTTTTAALSSPATDSDWESRVKVSCTGKQMKVIVSPGNHPYHHDHHNDLNEGTRRKKRRDGSLVYLDKLKDYPSCQPIYDESSDSYSFDLPLDDDTFFTCGTSRLKNKITGTKVFYHKVVIEQKILKGQGERSSASFSHSSSSPPPLSPSSHPSATASGTASSTDSASSSSSSPPSSLPIADAASGASRLVPDSHVKHLDQLHNRVRDRSSSALHASSHPHPDAAVADAAAGAADGSEDEDPDDHRSSVAVPADQEDGEEEDDWTQDTVTIRCIVPGDTSSAYPHPRSRRQVISEPDLPANFSESSEELIDFSGSVTGRAPMPLLNIAVKQNGEFVDTALNVSPGTPLEMVIYLDDVSSRVYGLLTTFLRVTDNTPRKQEEIIILNGCSIDPYIFANFETEDEGKSLSAKFRAFKFPESNYVLFVGTVNVCLKSCLGVQCGEGQVGFGRRKRSYDPLPFDPNKVFEAELTAFIRVGESDQHKSSLSSESHDPAILSADHEHQQHQQSSSSQSKVSRDLTRSHPLKWTSTPSAHASKTDRSGGSSSRNSSIMTQTDLFLTLIISISAAVVILSLTADRRIL